MKKMKAAVLEAVGAPLKIREVAVPVLNPGSGMALVRIHAAALNHRDNWIRKGQYAGIRTPLIPGSDGYGTVTAVADEIHSSWIGTQVIICPSIAWGNAKTHQDPQHYRILGLPDDGTLAEFVRVPVENLFTAPAHLTPAAAAALPLAGLTAFRALFSRAELKPGEKVLVSGIGGGVAMMALQFAIAAGADVWVTSSAQEKIDSAIEIGAEGGYLYTDPTWHKTAMAETGGLDVIIDGAAGPGFVQLMEAAAPGGRIAVYGGTRGAIPSLPPARLFWKQLSILGSTMGSPAEFHAMLDFVRKRKVVPAVASSFPLDHVNDALQFMEEGLQQGKIVIEF